MCRPVKPIIRKIICKKQEHPNPPAARIQFKDPVLIKESKQPKDHGLGAKANDHISDTKTETAPGITGFVKLPVLTIREPGLNGKKQDETGNGIIKKCGRHIQMYFLFLNSDRRCRF